MESPLCDGSYSSDSSDGSDRSNKKKITKKNLFLGPKKISHKNMPKLFYHFFSHKKKTFFTKIVLQ